MCSGVATGGQGGAVAPSTDSKLHNFIIKNSNLGLINVVAFGLSPVADPGGGIGGIYPPKHTFWPPIRMNLSIIISLLGTTIPNYNVFFVATIPKSNWWPGASPLDPLGLTALPKPQTGLISPHQRFLDSPLFAPPT